MNSKEIQAHLGNTVDTTNFINLGTKYEGKVRDVYSQIDKKRSIIIATDRQSAFDVSWCTIPFKGQVLNQISTWWFRQIADIMPTHIIDSPDPNVTVVKTLDMIPIEIVVRAYLTGSSKTSAWMNYANGIRNFCGNILPDGMRKNQSLPTVLVTPTTKSDDDELIDAETILSKQIVTKDQWNDITEKALALFKRGQELAATRGLILVDTKYEMGFDSNGVLTIADEVHTPDSSRYWLQSSYQDRLNSHDEPESLDKEFFRLWLKREGFEYGGYQPTITDDVRVMLSKKYIDLYEKITGESFQSSAQKNTLDRIQNNIAPYFLG